MNGLAVVADSVVRWLGLRLADGYTRRANSVYRCIPGASGEVKIETCESFIGTKGCPVRFQNDASGSTRTPG